MPSLVRKNDNNWKCLVGVGVSGWCMDGIWGWLGPSGLCPVYIDAKSIEKSQLDIVLMSYRSFFQCTSGPFPPKTGSSAEIFNGGWSDFFRGLWLILWFRWPSYGRGNTMGMVAKKKFDRTHLSPYPS